MDATIRNNIENLWLTDREMQNKAFLNILEATNTSIDWTYEVWDEMVAGLSHKDNRVRAIAAQILCNLSKSDPKNRMLKDFPALLAVTRDKRFVTARHCMQALWKVGTSGKKQQSLLVEGLTFRFKECINEKNCTLIRYDIIKSFLDLYNAIGDKDVKERALALIETEDDLKYRKKYATLWRKK